MKQPLCIHPRIPSNHFPAEQPESFASKFNAAQIPLCIKSVHNFYQCDMPRPKFLTHPIRLSGLPPLVSPHLSCSPKTSFFFPFYFKCAALPPISGLCTAVPSDLHGERLHLQDSASMPLPLGSFLHPLLHWVKSLQWQGIFSPNGKISCPPCCSRPWPLPGF